MSRCEACNRPLRGDATRCPTMECMGWSPPGGASPIDGCPRCSSVVLGADLEQLRAAAREAVELLAGAQTGLRAPVAFKNGALVTGVLDEQAALDVLARLRAALGEP